MFMSVYIQLMYLAMLVHGLPNRNETSAQGSWTD